MITRRTLLLSSAALGAIGLTINRLAAQDAPAGPPETFEVTRTDADWQAILTPEQYNVLRQEGTEYPFTSPLLDEHRVGTFNCAGCDLAVYDSATKYDSGTGWPSFYQAIDGSVRNKNDYSLISLRIEEHCRRCGGHLGHVFDDGPPPTGKRHCINGVALTFHPTADAPAAPAATAPAAT